MLLQTDRRRAHAQALVDYLIPCWAALLLELRLRHAFLQKHLGQAWRRARHHRQLLRDPAGSAQEEAWPPRLD